GGGTSEGCRDRGDLRLRFAGARRFGFAPAVAFAWRRRIVLARLGAGFAGCVAARAAAVAAVRLGLALAVAIAVVLGARAAVGARLAVVLGASVAVALRWLVAVRRAGRLAAAL